MAKQAETEIIGTYHNITFYKMNGKYYARRKSCLTGKRFFKDKAFEGSRRSSWRLAAGSKIAADVYGMIAAEERSYGLYCMLKTSGVLYGEWVALSTCCNVKDVKY